MRIIRQVITAFGIFIVLAGCDQQAMFDKFIPQEEAAIAKRLLSQLAAKDYDSVEKQLDPSIQAPSIRGTLEQMAAVFPVGDPKSITTVGSNILTSGGSTTYNLTFEHEYARLWLLTNVVLQRRNGQITVLGLHVNPMTQSLKQVNRFTFEGKGLTHYIIFVLAIGVPIFILYALVLCFKTPISKRKWLWLLFVAFGLVQFSFNWTNGGYGVQPISFLLFGAGYFQAGPFAPFIFRIAIPVGAIVFLVKRRSLRVAIAG